MKKGKLKEENVAKISITTKRVGEELDDYIKIFEDVNFEEINKLAKHMAKKKRRESN